MVNVKYLSEDRKKIFLSVVVIVLVIIAFLGYTFDKEKEPLRVAFDTKGGGVIFDHQKHTSLKDIQCSECHHNYEKGKRTSSSSTMRCRDCHYNKSSEFKEICKDENIHKRCIGKNCASCHIENSVDCDFCHNAEAFIKKSEPQKVEFNTDGGLVIFDHAAHASSDGYDVACDTCHHGYNGDKPDTKNSFPMSCRRCHYNKKYESICENEDTHVRCIGKNCVDCHTDGSEDCEICHKQ